MPTNCRVTVSRANGPDQNKGSEKPEIVSFDTVIDKLSFGSIAYDNTICVRGLQFKKPDSLSQAWGSGSNSTFVNCDGDGRHALVIVIRHPTDAVRYLFARQKLPHEIKTQVEDTVAYGNNTTALNANEVIAELQEYAEAGSGITFNVFVFPVYIDISPSQLFVDEPINANHVNAIEFGPRVPKSKPTLRDNYVNNDGYWLSTISSRSIYAPQRVFATTPKQVSLTNQYGRNSEKVFGQLFAQTDHFSTIALSIYLIGNCLGRYKVDVNDNWYLAENYEDDINLGEQKISDVLSDDEIRKRKQEFKEEFGILVEAFAGINATETDAEKDSPHFLYVDDDDQASPKGKSYLRTLKYFPTIYKDKATVSFDSGRHTIKISGDFSDVTVPAWKCAWFRSSTDMWNTLSDGKFVQEQKEWFKESKKHMFKDGIQITGDTIDEIKHNRAMAKIKEASDILRQSGWGDDSNLPDMVKNDYNMSFDDDELKPFPMPLSPTPQPPTPPAPPVPSAPPPPSATKRMVMFVPIDDTDSCKEWELLPSCYDDLQMSSRVVRDDGQMHDIDFQTGVTVVSSEVASGEMYKTEEVVPTVEFASVTLNEVEVPDLTKVRQSTGRQMFKRECPDMYWKLVDGLAHRCNPRITPLVYHKKHGVAVLRGVLGKFKTASKSKEIDAAIKAVDLSKCLESDANSHAVTEWLELHGFDKKECNLILAKYGGTIEFINGNMFSEIYEHELQSHCTLMLEQLLPHRPGEKVRRADLYFHAKRSKSEKYYLIPAQNIKMSTHVDTKTCGWVDLWRRGNSGPILPSLKVAHHLMDDFVEKNPGDPSCFITVHGKKWNIKAGFIEDAERALQRNIFTE